MNAVILTQYIPLWCWSHCSRYRECWQAFQGLSWPHCFLGWTSSDYPMQEYKELAISAQLRTTLEVISVPGCTLGSVEAISRSHHTAPSPPPNPTSSPALSLVWTPGTSLITYQCLRACLSGTPTCDRPSLTQYRQCITKVNLERNVIQQRARQSSPCLDSAGPDARDTGAPRARACGLHLTKQGLQGDTS